MKKLLSILLLLSMLLPFAAPRFKKVTYPRGFSWKLPVSALFYVATLVLLYESYRYIPTGIVVALQYTFPLLPVLPITQ